MNEWQKCLHFPVLLCGSVLHSVVTGKIFMDCGTGTKIPLVTDELQNLTC
jgi:hypothetical protein